MSARVELIQVYRNTTSSSNAEARYIFPIPANAAVCAFKMTSEDGREIKGVVKKLETANREYDAAVENNIWAGLLERLSGDGLFVNFWLNGHCLMKNCSRSICPVSR